MRIAARTALYKAISPDGKPIFFTNIPMLPKIIMDMIRLILAFCNLFISFSPYIVLYNNNLVKSLNWNLYYLKSCLFMSLNQLITHCSYILN